MKQNLEFPEIESPRYLGAKKEAPLAAGGVSGELLYRFDFAAGASVAQNIVTTQKIRVVDAFLILRGTGVASEVVTIGNAANAISDALAASGADKALVRASTIDDANWEIEAGGSLRATPSAGASQPAMTVYVIAHAV